MRAGADADKSLQSTCVCTQSYLTLAIPRTVAHQAPLSVEFSKQGYWSGLPFPPPGDVPDPGIRPRSLASPALAGGFFSLSHLGAVGTYSFNKHLLSRLSMPYGIEKMGWVGAGENQGRQKAGQWVDGWQGG